jgi:hypothetical protein
MGSLTFTTQSGLGILPGAFVVVNDQSTPSNYVHGQVTNYSGSTLTINSLDTGGSGTISAWDISPSGPQGTSGGGTGTVGSGTANQIAYYASNGTVVSSTSALPNGTTATTQSSGDNSTKVATTAYVGTATSTLAPLASPVFTGTPSLPTGAFGITQLSSDNSTKLATTAFVNSVIATGVKTVKVQSFTSSSTYTPSAGMLYCIIEMVGGGGGGGGVSGNTGGCGAAGAYIKALLTAAQIGASQAITIGAAGTGGISGGGVGGSGGGTTVGSLLSCTGGTGGSASAGVPGTGGTATVTTGTPILAMNGSRGTYVYTANLTSAPGACSLLGFGGYGAVTNGPNAGGDATGYGAGGGGGNSPGSAAGGAGSQGVVIITEFCSQ